MEDIKKLTNEELQDRIAANKMRVGEIEECLPYADGLAYFNDREALILLRARQDDLRIELVHRQDVEERRAHAAELENAKLVPPPTTEYVKQGEEPPILDIRRQRVEDQARIQALETALTKCAKQFRSMGCLGHAQMAQTALEDKE